MIVGMNDVPAFPQENIATGDLVAPQKSLFAASAGEIFWRNFLAGASRAFGAIVVYLIFLVLMGIFMSQVVLPQILPLLGPLNAAFCTINSLNTTDMIAPTNTSNTDLDADLLNQLQLLQGSTNVETNSQAPVPEIQNQNGQIYQATPVR